MAESTKRRYYNIVGLTHNNVSVTTVQSVQFSESWDRIAGQGDDDKGDVFQAKVNLKVSGSITLEDPLQAHALVNASQGTLTYGGTPAPGGTAKTVTIENVLFFTNSNTDSHNNIGNMTVNFNAIMKSDGSSPVSVVAA